MSISVRFSGTFCRDAKKDQTPQLALLFVICKSFFFIIYYRIDNIWFGDEGRIGKGGQHQCHCFISLDYFGLNYLNNEGESCTDMLNYC